MVKAIRDVEKTLGDWIRKPTKGEEEIKRLQGEALLQKWIYQKELL